MLIFYYQGATQQQKDMIEQAAQVIAQENTELASAFIQKTAVERAIPEMDKRLATVSYRLGLWWPRFSRSFVFIIKSIKIYEYEMKFITPSIQMLKVFMVHSCSVNNVVQTQQR